MWMAISIMIATGNIFAQQKTDSLEILLEQAGDSARASILYQIAKQEYNTAPDKCLEYAIEAAELARKRGDSALQAMSYQIAGVVYKNQGQFDRAMEYQIKAAQILDEIGSDMLLASSYNDLGVLNKNLGNFNKAIEYYHKSLAIIREMGNERVEALLLNNIGTIYDAKENLDSAEIFYRESLKINKRIGNKNGQALSYNNLGEMYAKKKQYIKALDHFYKTLEIDIENDNRMGMIYSYLNLARAHSAIDQHQKSLEHFRSAEKLAVEMNASALLSQAYRGMSHTLEEMGRYSEALKFHKSYSDLEDSVFNERKSKQIEELQTRYETEKKERDIQMLSQQNEIRELRINKQHEQIIILVLLIILLSGTGGFIIYRNRQKHTSNLQSERIRQKELAMKAVITAVDEERKRIAKDLHDGIGQTLSGLKLSWEALSSSVLSEKPEEKNRLGKLSAILDDACQDVRNISHQMMPKELSEFGLVPAIEDMLLKSLGDSSMQYNFEHFGVDERLEENVEIALFRITQELINNVIKHSGASKVAVQLIRSARHIVLIVEDNGKGFDSDSARTSGIGLLNIASRIDTINGEINYEPSPGSGTVARVRVPLRS